MARGPIVVLGRPHSGTRLLAGLLRSSGVFMGADLTHPQLDSWSMHQRFVVPLLGMRLTADPSEQREVDLDRFAQACFDAAWPRYTGTTMGPGEWGWKCCETTFVMPAVRRLLPTSVFVHLIRDGRDVILSDRGYFQLTAPTSDPPGWQPASPLGSRLSYRDFSRLITFGEAGVRHWRGIDLDDPRDVVGNRYLLQMQAWLTAVTWARRDGATLGGGYHEVRYEELCTSPVEVARALFRRLGLPWSVAAVAFLDRHAVATRVGHWRRARLSRQETRDFTRAGALAQRVLAECGYAS